MLGECLRVQEVPGDQVCCCGKFEVWRVCASESRDSASRWESVFVCVLLETNPVSAQLRESELGRGQSAGGAAVGGASAWT